MATPEYTKPADRLWQEAQEKNGNASSSVLSTFSDEAPKGDGKERELTVEGNQTDAYVGTDPIYQNYANETEAPLGSEKGVEAKLEDRIIDTVPSVPSKEAAKDEEAGDKDSGSRASVPASSAGLTTGVQTPSK